MLLLKRRFLPFFISQFFGAFTDNLYKNALLVYLTLHLTDGRMLSLYTNLSMALFIFPMFLFSAWSGLLADRFEKRFLIIRVKWLEVFIMVIGISAFLLNLIPLMVTVLFLLGLHSTFFGPVKYGILPERLHESELMLGNGLIEAGTFFAILGGTLLGASLIARETLHLWLFAAMAASTLTGLASAYAIPAYQGTTDRHALPPFHPWQQTKALLSYTAKQKTIFQCVLAISWFWLLGGALLTQIPQYTKDVLNSTPDVTTYLLVLFSIGIGIGSLLSNLLARGRIEAGLVPVGAFILALGLWMVIGIDSDPAITTAQKFSAFLDDARFIRVSLGFFIIAFGGGIYAVPLYAIIQHRAESGHKSQVIAANNIINALFLVLISIVSAVILSVLGWSLQALFTLLLILHLAISLYIFKVVPEFIMRCLVIIIIAFFYRVRVQGKEHLPKTGAAIIACNHVSYMDALILMVAIRRPIRFIMYYKIFQVPVLSYIFKSARAIPIAGRFEDAKLFHQSFIGVHEALEKGQIVGIFPEGELSLNGNLGEYKRGIEKMLENDPVPVIPVTISNLWGSLFSHAGGLMKGGPRKWFARITVTIGTPLPPDTNARTLQAVTQAMLDKVEEQEKTVKKG